MTRQFKLGFGQTQIVQLLTGESEESIIRQSLAGAADGADGITVELHGLPPEKRNAQVLKRIMEAVPLPFMFNSYRRDPGYTDEQRAQDLLNAADAKPDIVDVMGDQFHASPEEHLTAPEDIRRRQELIDELHRRGVRVELSSHTNCFLASGVILRRLQEFEDAGADLVKLVTRADTPEEYAESCRGTILASHTLKTPFIHLCGGKFARPHRVFGLFTGLAFTFAVHEPSGTYGMQPLIKDALAVRDHAMNYTGKLEEIFK